MKLFVILNYIICYCIACIYLCITYIILLWVLRSVLPLFTRVFTVFQSTERRNVWAWASISYCYQKMPSQSVPWVDTRCRQPNNFPPLSCESKFHVELNSDCFLTGLFQLFIVLLLTVGCKGERKNPREDNRKENIRTVRLYWKSRVVRAHHLVHCKHTEKHSLILPLCVEIYLTLLFHSLFLGPFCHHVPLQEKSI